MKAKTINPNELVCKDFNSKGELDRFISSRIDRDCCEKLNLFKGDSCRLEITDIWVVFALSIKSCRFVSPWRHQSFEKGAKRMALPAGRTASGLVESSS